MVVVVKLIIETDKDKTIAATTLDDMTEIVCKKINGKLAYDFGMFIVKEEKQSWIPLIDISHLI